MKIKVTVTVPDDVDITREDLQTILASTPYRSDVRMMKRIKVGDSGKNRYSTGRFPGVTSRWKAVPDYSQDAFEATRPAEGDPDLWRKEREEDRD